MIEIDCAISGGDWPNMAKIHNMAERAIHAAVEKVPDRIRDDAELSLLFTDDAEIQGLNAQWRETDKSTNVLSFASNEGDGPASPMLGDIVLAHETIVREASQQEKTFEAHLSHLIVHGFLHLLGYDHIEDGQADAMENLEREICSSLGIADPYAAH